MQRGAIQYLPREGRAIVIADLHGDIFTFWSLLSKANFDKNKDYLIQLGDIVDNKTKEDVDALLLWELRMRKEEDSQRHVILKGNHEWEAELRYGLQLGKDYETKSYPYHNRMNSGDYNFISSMPYVARAENGLVFCHHAPANCVEGIEWLENYDLSTRVDDTLAQDLFYNGDRATRSNDQGEQDVANFLHNLDANFVITGHRPAAGLEKVMDNWGRLGTRHDRKTTPSCLEIDLSKTYSSLDEIIVHSL